jgi:predicted tellurium resistance membrane protein TerC
MEFLAFPGWQEPGTWLSLATLTALEIVLGVDNLVFIAILSGRLPAEKQAFGRRLGLALALVTRLMLLAAIAWIASLTRAVMTVAGVELSWRDIALLAGGAFLLYKATHEIHGEVEGGHEDAGARAGTATVAAVVTQIALIDIVFSLDSVITAVGMAEHRWVMALAVILAMILMITAATPLSSFVTSHPTVKMLALSFLLMIGVVLVADGLHFHIPRGYVYTALAFSILVEALNFRARRRRKAR